MLLKNQKNDLNLVLEANESKEPKVITEKIILNLFLVLGWS
jgi:hypothetical protein